MSAPNPEKQQEQHIDEISSAGTLITQFNVDLRTGYVKVITCLLSLRLTEDPRIGSSSSAERAHMAQTLRDILTSRLSLVCNSWYAVKCPLVHTLKRAQ
jgi:hypothetical protein